MRDILRFMVADCFNNYMLVHTCVLKTIDLRGWGVTNVYYKGDCRYFKLIIVTFFSFMIYMYKYNQAEILHLLLCV